MWWLSAVQACYAQLMLGGTAPQRDLLPHLYPHLHPHPHSTYIDTPPRLPRPLTHLRPGYEQFIPVPCSPHIKQGPGVVVRFNAGPVAAILQQAKGSGQGQGRGRDRARAGAGQRQRQGQGQL